MARTAKISTKVEPKFRARLDILLSEVGWDESEYVRRSCEEYLPKLVTLVDSVRGTAP